MYTPSPNTLDIESLEVMKISKEKDGKRNELY